MVISQINLVVLKGLPSFLDIYVKHSKLLYLSPYEDSSTMLLMLLPSQTEKNWIQVIVKTAQRTEYENNSTASCLMENINIVFIIFMIFYDSYD